jgi:hypothetical protein
MKFQGGKDSDWREVQAQKGDGEEIENCKLEIGNCKLLRNESLPGGGN